MVAILISLFALITSMIGLYIIVVVSADVMDKCNCIDSVYRKCEDLAAFNDKILVLNDKIIKTNEELTHYIYSEKIDDAK